MTNFPTIRIRIRRKLYRLIFTGLMAMMMSLIISSALLLVKVGYVDGFFYGVDAFLGTGFYFCVAKCVHLRLSNTRACTEQDRVLLNIPAHYSMIPNNIAILNLP
ncbi:hypothetical protein [Psychrobacter sp. JCM 18901]|uniref:hypothetical protein n=1 Tax=Psychrobacter sp. JCM 18901 TaxID=1298609 RepID=UPI0004B8F5A4|nr:hypothetical protein [Psychrobacter sp. JCM 18901]